MPEWLYNEVTLGVNVMDLGMLALSIALLCLAFRAEERDLPHDHYHEDE